MLTVLAGLIAPGCLDDGPPTCLMVRGAGLVPANGEYRMTHLPNYAGPPAWSNGKGWWMYRWHQTYWYLSHIPDTSRMVDEHAFTAPVKYTTLADDPVPPPRGWVADHLLLGHDHPVPYIIPCESVPDAPDAEESGAGDEPRLFARIGGLPHRPRPFAGVSFVVLVVVFLVGCVMAVSVRLLDKATSSTKPSHLAFVPPPSADTFIVEPLKIRAQDIPIYPHNSVDELKEKDRAAAKVQALYHYGAQRTDPPSASQKSLPLLHSV